MLNISTDCFPFSSFRSGERVWFNGEWNQIRIQTEQKRCNTALHCNIKYAQTHTNNERIVYLHVVCGMQLARCVVSDAILQRHKQRIDVLETLELGLVDVGDDTAE